MSDRLIAIGDIHGCIAALDALLESISPDASDTIVTLGDYIDRGPDSKAVIDRLIDLKSRCRLIPLIGNHEEMMLDVIENREPPYRWLQFGGVQTLDSYGFAGDMSVIPETHLQFFSELLDYYESSDHFFVHANYEAGLQLQDQSIDYLRWLKIDDELPPPHFSGRKAVVGHTHSRDAEIVEFPHLICLDTYCYGGGWLTAMDLMAGQVWQSDIGGNLRTNP